MVNNLITTCVAPTRPPKNTNEDLTKALEADANIIGINNRNLSSFETDPENAMRIAGLLEPGQIAVAACGITDRRDIEKNLPLDDKHKNYTRGSESPIVVANEVFTAGDTKAGVQTLAFNLPNDERVRQAKGSKKVMLKNVHEAKFEKLLKL
jgi:hypothetical protein